MSEYVRAEYTPLFTQVQDIIAESLNSDPQLSSLGITFYPEHNLEIEYEIKKNLGQQGIVGIVNTLKGFYGGHNGNTNAWEIEAEIDVVENPTIRRAQMKKMGLSAGSTADIIDWVQESLCGPSSPSYGKFCAQQQQLGEDSGLIVGKSIVKTFAIADVSAIVSGEHMWHCPYALASDLEDLSGLVYDMDVKVDWLDYAVQELSSEISGGSGEIWNVIGALSSDVNDISVQLSGKADDSELENYLNLTENTRQFVTGPVSFTHINGTLLNVTDTYQTNYLYDENDTYNSIRSNDVSSLLIRGNYSQASAILPIKTGTIAYTSDIPTKVSDLTNDAGYLTTVSWNDVQDKPSIPTKTSDLVNDSNYVNQQTLNTALLGKVNKSGDTVQWIGIGRIEQRIQANEQLGFEFSIDEFGSAKVVPQRGSNATLNFPSTDGTLATTADISSQIPTKTSDLTNDSGFITGTTLNTELALKQDKLTDEQMANVNTKYLPLNLSGNVEISGYNYLDFYCLPRFFAPVVMNGALDVQQLNIVNYDVDSYTALSAMDEDTLGFVGGFNREHVAVLNLKSDTLAYISDISAMYEARISALETRIAALENQ